MERFAIELPTFKVGIFGVEREGGDGKREEDGGTLATLHTHEAVEVEVLTPFSVTSWYPVQAGPFSNNGSWCVAPSTTVKSWFLQFTRGHFHRVAPVLCFAVDIDEYKSDCPTVCPARDVMVCARCKEGVYRTFMSVCHLRNFNCKHPEESE